MKKLIATMVTLMFLTSGCIISSPFKGMEDNQIQVADLDNNTVTTIDPVSYAQKLQAEIVQECRDHLESEKVREWTAIGTLTGTEKLVAITGNQWKEAMMSINGQDLCAPGTGPWDAFIAYAKAEGRVWEVIVTETGQTLRFAAGAGAAAFAVDKLADAMGDKIGGDKIEAGENGTMADRGSAVEASSTTDFTETHATSLGDESPPVANSTNTRTVLPPEIPEETPEEI